MYRQAIFNLASKILLIIVPLRSLESDYLLTILVMQQFLTVQNVVVRAVGEKFFNFAKVTYILSESSVYEQKKKTSLSIDTRQFPHDFLTSA